MRSVLLGLSVATVLTFSGCGAPSAPQGSGPAAKPDVAASSNEELKKTLEGIAATGEMGSAAAGLEPSIDELAKKEPDKGAALKKDFAQLQAEPDPAKIKAIAKKMADSL